MTTMLGSVRRFIHNWENGEDPEMSPSEFRSMEKQPSPHSWRGYGRPRREVSTNTTTATTTTMGVMDSRNDPMEHTAAVRALSPKSASSSNDRYQLMDDHDEQGESRQGPPTGPEADSRIPEGLLVIQRRVSDSWRTLQGASKRLVLNGKAVLDRRHATMWPRVGTASGPSSPRSPATSRFTSQPLAVVQKAVHQIKKSLGREDATQHAFDRDFRDEHSSPSEGFIRFDDDDKRITARGPAAQDIVAS